MRFTCQHRPVKALDDLDGSDWFLTSTIGFDVPYGNQTLSQKVKRLSYSAFSRSSGRDQIASAFAENDPAYTKKMI